MLPLRGKILNVERNTDAAMYKNEEIAALIVALGLGLKGDAVPALRYGKVRNLCTCKLTVIERMENNICFPQGMGR